MVTNVKFNYGHLKDGVSNFIWIKMSVLKEQLKGFYL